MANRFGFWTLVFLVVANMIGAGVFTTSGFSLQALGSPSLVVWAWIAGGLIAISGAYSYGMLIRAMPESGGEYLFLSRAAHPMLGFIAGWVSLIAGFSGAIAFAATAFEAYVLPETSRPDWMPAGTIAVMSIVLAGGMHGLKPTVGAVLQNAVVLIKLGLLAMILLFAGSQLPSDQWQGTATSANDLSGWALVSAFTGSLVWISLSYAGFNAAVYIAGEVDQADRTVPRSLVIGTAIVVVLYLLLNSVFVHAPPAASIVGKADVAAIAARSLGGSWFEQFVRWTIAVCLLTSVFSMMMAAPRVYAKMADDGLFPALFRFQGESPRSSTILQIFVAVLLVVVSSLQGLLSYLGLTLSISSACSVLCLFLPAVTKTKGVGVEHVVPAFYVVCTLIAAGLMASFNPWQTLGTVMTVVVGLVAYVATRLMKR